MKCVKGFDIIPCKSGAGWYLGTRDEMGCPNCRISSYVATKEEAATLKPDRYYASEVKWCNGGQGCIVKE